MVAGSPRRRGEHLSRPDQATASCRLKKPHRPHLWHCYGLWLHHHCKSGLRRFLPSHQPGKHNSGDSVLRSHPSECVLFMCCFDPVLLHEGVCFLHNASVLKPTPFPHIISLPLRSHTNGNSQISAVARVLRAGQSSLLAYMLWMSPRSISSF